jgi:hypothetical protein
MVRHLHTVNPKAAIHHNKDTADSKATANPHHSRAMVNLLSNKDMANLRSSMEGMEHPHLVRADMASLVILLSRGMVRHLLVGIR